MGSLTKNPGSRGPSSKIPPDSGAFGRPKGGDFLGQVEAVVRADGADLGNGLGVLSRIVKGVGNGSCFVPEDHADFQADPVEILF